MSYNVSSDGVPVLRFERKVHTIRNMKLRYIKRTFLLVHMIGSAIFCPTSFAQDASPVAFAQNVAPVIIDYFYEPGCPDCMKVKNQIMPELEERFETFYVLNKYDLGIKTNVIRLAAYQEHLKIEDNEPVSMVVDYEHVLNGFSTIKSGLFRQLDEAIAERMEYEWKSTPPIILPENSLNSMDTVGSRIKGFTAIAVILAGLTDGINPCAIATLIFFMSVLAVGKVKGRRLLLMGIPFCLASFMTYTALGFGFLRILHLLEGFDLIRMVIEWGMILMLSVFAFLSFRDAYRYKKTGKPGDVSLQLPDGIKKLIHKVIREEVRGEGVAHRRQERGVGENGVRLIVAGFTIGLLVTALESVCTGQMYVPTLVLMIQEGQGTSRIWGYLLTYNLMFIVPLVTVFVLVYFGMRTDALIDWSKKNVVISKTSLGLMFIGLGILMIIL